MGIELKKLSITDCLLLQERKDYRPIYVSERQFVNQFLWEEFYDTYYYHNDLFTMYATGLRKGNCPMMPLCKADDIQKVFEIIKDHWNNVLHLPLTMYSLDQTFLDTLMTIPGFSEEFKVVDIRDAYDYIYDAEKLRTLSGKAYHKKKNHLNSFLKSYAGRFEYRSLHCKDIDEIQAFHDSWLLNRDYEDKYGSMRSEENGIRSIFKNCGFIDCEMGGVYVDGKLEAYSIGSYAPDVRCAFIHIEKANVSIPGLYNYISQ